MVLSIPQYMNSHQQLYLIPEIKYLLINKKTKQILSGKFLFMNPAKTMAYFEDLADAKTNNLLHFTSEYQKWIDLQLYSIAK